MNDQIPFDLNRSIQRWRESLAQCPAFYRENLDELESHLRDSVAALEARGLLPAEAFLVAARRIGASHTLETEFGKMNGAAIWTDRLFWMLIGYQVWGFVSGIIGLVTGNALLFGLNSIGYSFKSVRPDFGSIPVVVLFTLVHLGGFAGSVAVCWWLFCRKGRNLSSWLNRLLRRRANWFLLFSLLCLLAFSVRLTGWGIQALQIKFFGLEKFGGCLLAQQFSSVFTQLIVIAVLAGITLFLARKRLRVREA